MLQGFRKIAVASNGVYSGVTLLLEQLCFSSFQTVLSSAVQCSLSEDGSEKVPEPKRDQLVKPEAPRNDETECTEVESDTESVCSDCSTEEEWLVALSCRIVFIFSVRIRYTVYA